MSFGHKSPDGQTSPQPRSSELTNRILVVEDDPSVQRVLKRLFEAEGLAVDTYSDGRAGLDSFHADAPSATILDLNLPKLSGRTLCREMKAAAPSIPIIILSASCDLHDKVALLEMGADDYVTKPFSPRELLARCAWRCVTPSPSPERVRLFLMALWSTSRRSRSPETVRQSS